MNRRRLGHSKAVAARGEHRRRLPEEVLKLTDR